MDTRQVVHDAAEKIIDVDDHFTSVDVANSIKRNGTWLSNSAVASILHDLVDDEYGVFDSISAQQVAFTDFTATVYYTSGSDPDDYEPGMSAMTPDQFKALHGNDPFDDGEEEELETKNKDDASVDTSTKAQPVDAKNKKGYGNDGLKFCFPYDK